MRRDSLLLPASYDTPLSIGSSEVWPQTGLDVKSVFDPEDEDRITVRPNLIMRTALDALEHLGFGLKSARNESAPDRFKHRLTFAQEVEFGPKRGEFAGRPDELELLMFPSEGSVDLVMQVDRPGFRGESYAELTFSEGEAPQGPDGVAEALAEAIRRHS